MSLQAKVLNLKLNAALAVKHAQGWQRLIDLYGEDKATAFYTHLGLNHLEKKSFEWEGLTLSREPKEFEKIVVKGISSAQDSAFDAVSKLLLITRKELISDGLKGIKKLDPADYHTLTLHASEESRHDLRDRLSQIHKQGRLLVAAELGKKEALPEDQFDELDNLVDLTESRVANEVQARIIAAAARYRLLGLTGNDLIEAVRKEITGGTVSYIDRASRGVSNMTLNIGRDDEMRNRADEIDRYEYSALLDVNTCSPCAAADGQESDALDDLPEAPNPECEGGDYCRCFRVAIAA